MLGAIYPGQMYPAGIPVFGTPHDEISAPPLTMRQITSHVARASNITENTGTIRNTSASPVARALNITGDTGTIRRKTSGTPSVRNIEGSQ